MAVAEQPPRLAVAQAVDDSAVLKKLSTLDRFLPLWTAGRHRLAADRA